MSRDRFTEKDEKDRWAVRLNEDNQLLVEHSETVNADGSKTCTPTMVYAPFVDRLAEYECTGVEPEEFELYGIVRLANQMPFKRFVQIHNAEDEGRLAILPCKVGDTVWLIDTRFVNGRQLLRCRVNEFTIPDREGKVYAVLDGAEDFYAVRRFRAVSADDFGKIVFLNEAQAKTAVKLLKTEKKHERAERETEGKET